ncbi:MAG: hypothetical protein EZS26_001984 [Candidatus Ordinivivax streblomastigis]|uniref:SbsA Ig-like domain-containing protein n=1 Tax=Candidatus Ordinivivax streblomastigis TaxID=2540710 RepID=A0A5M8P088_9BACT|nr:MAG: hypothetical protein EZS26_001984 [Candidatus Ordinivivax streblomastigis]
MKKTFLFLCALLMSSIAFSQTAPVIVEVYPRSGATNVGLWIGAFEATFDQNIVAGDLSEVLVNGVPATGVVVENNVLWIDCDPFITFSTDYTVTIRTGAVQGLAADYSWSFRTRDYPTVSTSTPVNGATDVAPDVAMDITGSAITGYEIDVEIVDESGESILAYAHRTAFDASTIKHPLFKYNTNYTVKLFLFYYWEGHQYLIPYPWTFSTETAPVKEWTAPVDDATNVSLTAATQVKFDKRILEGPSGLSGITIKDEAGNDVSDRKSISGSVLFIYHRDLASNTKYTVTVPANAVLGISEEIKYAFTTTNVTGIADVDKETGVSVYPTVSNGNLTIATPGKAKVAVLDVSGRTLASYPSNGNLTIDLNYANGLYIIKVDNNGKVSSHKVILKKQ